MNATLPRRTKQTLAALVALVTVIATGTARAVDFTWDPISGDSVITEGSGNWDTTTTNWTTDGGTTNVVGGTGSNPFGEDLIFGGGTAGTAGTVTLTETGNQFGSIEFLTPNAGTYTIDLNGNTVTLRRSANTIRVGEAAIISDGFGGGALNFQGDTDIRFQTNTTLSISAVVGTVSAGTINVNLGGTVDLSGVNTFTHNITLANQSKLIISGAGQLGSGNYAGNITLNQNGEFEYASSANQTLSGVISDDYPEGQPNDVIMSGSGTLTLTGANTYQGPTTISSGTLEIGGSGSLGGGTYTGTITNNGTLEYTSDQAQTLSGNITGTGALVKDGSTSVLTLSGNNGYSGTTTIDQGTVRAGSTVGLSTQSDFTVNSGGVLQLNGFNNSIGGLDGTAGGVVENGGASDAELNIDPSTPGTHSFAGVIQDGSGGGILSLRLRQGGTQTLTGNNTFTGDINLQNGAKLLIDGAGTLGWNGFEGDYAGNITLVNNTDFEYASSANQTLSGVLDDDGAPGGGNGPSDWIKSGSGILTLTGTNTYEGPTTINAGILSAQNATALGTTAGATTVASGATLNVTGGISIAENISITGLGDSGQGAINSDGNNTLTGLITLTAAGSLIQSDSGTLSIDGGIATSGGDRNLTLSGATDINSAVNLGTNGDIFFQGVSGSPATHTVDGSGHDWEYAYLNFSGTAQLDASDALPTDSGLIFGWNGASAFQDTGTLDMNGFDQTVTSLETRGAAIGSAGTRTITGGGTLTVNQTTETEFDGVIEDGAGTTALTKTNAGTFTLSGINTYTGDTIVDGGTLALANSGTNNNIDSSPLIFVNTGATLDVTGLASSRLDLVSGQTLSGDGTVLGDVSLPVTATLDPGPVGGIGTLTFDDLTLLGTTHIDLGSTTDQILVDSLAYGGALNLDVGTDFGPGVYQLFDFTSFSGDFTSVSLVGGGSFTLDSIGGDVWNFNVSGQEWTFTQSTGLLSLSLATPEPSTLLLIAMALLGLLPFARPSRRRS